MITNTNLNKNEIKLMKLNYHQVSERKLEKRNLQQSDEHLRSCFRYDVQWLEPNPEAMTFLELATGELVYFLRMDATIMRLYTKLAAVVMTSMVKYSKSKHFGHEAIPI